MSDEEVQYDRWLVVSKKGDHWMVTRFHEGEAGESGKPYADSLFQDLLSDKKEGLLDVVFLCENISDKEAMTDDKEHTSTGD